MASYTLDELARFIDHTNLHADASADDLRILCNEARAWNFCMVAVNQCQAGLCHQLLEDSDVHVGTAISFPLGQTSIYSKIQDTRDAIECGADEIDYVVNLTEVKNGNWDYVREEMECIVAICREGRGGGMRGAADPITCKVIFENCYLTELEKIRLCEIASEVKPDFIKTSTGFG
ncbi:MAG: deoxyribose-phosphate aldolase, partial [Coriobacteriales bacterium]|nr:deoxyribose-phosphate aldolase [Coriobacteriales bacterium]